MSRVCRAKGRCHDLKADLGCWVAERVLFGVPLKQDIQAAIQRDQGRDTQPAVPQMKRIRSFTTMNRLHSPPCIRWLGEVHSSGSTLTSCVVGALSPGVAQLLAGSRWTCNI